jgi:hypothetical protein
MVIGIVKKHIKPLLQPFDPDASIEFESFLKTLAFQTGHSMKRHTQAYASEEAYPAELQPDLIDRYYQSSLLWHRFLLLRKEDLLLCWPNDKEVAHVPSPLVGYSPDLHLIADGHGPENIESELQVMSEDDNEELRPGQSYGFRPPPRTACRKRKQADIPNNTTLTDSDEEEEMPVPKQPRRARKKQPKFSGQGQKKKNSLPPLIALGGIHHLFY